MGMIILVGGDKVNNYRNKNNNFRIKNIYNRKRNNNFRSKNIYNRNRELHYNNNSLLPAPL